MEDARSKVLLRFNARYKVADNNCWEWQGEMNGKGYGRFWYKGKRILAHRFSYQFYKGKMPAHLVTDHLCRNRKCVNPEHLEAVTQYENINRGFAPSMIYKRRNHCKHGHGYTLENTSWRVKKSTGSKYRICQQCNRDRVYAIRAKRKLIS